APSTGSSCTWLISSLHSFAYDFRAGPSLKFELDPCPPSLCDFMATARSGGSNENPSSLSDGACRSRPSAW
ncbi:MAG: hypothetical protein NZM37_12560, partial [Sandaracinaceae bacterium]|nr:hypothetical protein [Sandaracinaceae bacterium]